MKYLHLKPPPPPPSAILVLLTEMLKLFSDASLSRMIVSVISSFCIKLTNPRQEIGVRRGIDRSASSAYITCVGFGGLEW